MEYEVRMTVTRTNSVKTYVHAESQDDAERKVQAAMELATEKEAANDVGQLTIDGKETPVEYDDYVSDDFRLTEVRALTACNSGRQTPGGPLLPEKERTMQRYRVAIHATEPYEMVTVVAAESLEDAEAKVHEAMDDAHGDRRVHEVEWLNIDGETVEVKMDEDYWPTDEFTVAAHAEGAEAARVFGNPGGEVVPRYQVDFEVDFREIWSTEASSLDAAAHWLEIAIGHLGYERRVDVVMEGHDVEVSDPTDQWGPLRYVAKSAREVAAGETPLGEGWRAAMKKMR